MKPFKGERSSHIQILFQWGAFYLFIADFFATQIIGGAKSLWSFCD